MKNKFKFFGLFFVLALLSVIPSFSPKAYALACKTGQSLNSDECWTWVTVSAQETGVVSPGSVLVYDVATDSALRNSFEVRLATASIDSTRFAGVAQRLIATTDADMILVRGKGKLAVVGIVSTGDNIFTSSSKGKAGTTAGAYSKGRISSSDSIAFSLQNSTATDATIDAYITGFGQA